VFTGFVGWRLFPRPPRLMIKVVVCLEIHSFHFRFESGEMQFFKLALEYKHIFLCRSKHSLRKLEKVT
jgi:hypothetical protein